MPEITAPPRLQRADGALGLRFDCGSDGHSRLADLYQHDPCRALLPNPDPGEPLTAVLVTTSGGLTGGDRLNLSVTVASGAAALCTPQAAEKIYRAEAAGDPAGVTLSLTVGAGAALEWLPQETILFDGARLRRQVMLDLAVDARLLAGDITVFGRIARGERFASGLLFDRWRLNRGGHLVWHDASRLDGAAIPDLLDHPAGFGGATAQALILYHGPDAAAHRDQVRQLLREEVGSGLISGGATLIDGLLLIRLLDAQPAHLRRRFGLIWASLRSGLGHPGAMPRHWHF